MLRASQGVHAKHNRSTARVVLVESRRSTLLCRKTGRQSVKLQLLLTGSFLERFALTAFAGHGEALAVVVIVLWSWLLLCSGRACLQPCFVQHAGSAWPSTRRGGADLRSLFALERQLHDTRTPLGAMAHPIIAVAPLLHPAALPPGIPEDDRGGIAGLLRDLTFAAGGREASFLGVLGQWREEHGAKNSLPYLRSVPCHLAMLWAHGHHEGDVVSCPRRSRSTARALVPGLPGKKLRARYFRETNLASLWEALQQEEQVVAEQVGKRRRGAIQVFSPQHLLRALRASRSLKRQSHLERTARDCVRLVAPGAAGEILLQAEAAGLAIPKAKTLHRARMALDAARMLYERRIRRAAPHFRYLMLDASPVRGNELLGGRLDLIPTSAVAVGAEVSVDLSALRRITMPLLGLSAGQMGGAGKLGRLLHATFLEDGPGRSSMQSALSEVLSFTSDLGVEAALVDAASCFTEWAELWDPRLANQAKDGGLPAAEDFLLPNAIFVPGHGHLCDWLGSQCVQQLPFYTAWRAEASAVCTFLGHGGYRNRLFVLFTAFARMQGWPAGAAEGRSLRHFSAGFSPTRWHAVHRVCVELLRVQADLTAAWPLVLADSKAWNIREGTSLAEVSAAVQSTLFWRRAKLLARLVEIIQRFASWGQGCQCHEDSLLVCGPCVPGSVGQKSTVGLGQVPGSSQTTGGGLRLSCEPRGT